MTELEDFDLESFQVEVLNSVRELEPEKESIDIFLRYVTVYSDGIELHPIASGFELYSKAKIYLSSDTVRESICPAIQSLSDDAFEIAKIITPILVTLNFAGTISIDLDPILFATIALVTARMGIATLCKDWPDNEND